MATWESIGDDLVIPIYALPGGPRNVEHFFRHSGTTEDLTDTPTTKHVLCEYVTWLKTNDIGLLLYIRH